MHLRNVNQFCFEHKQDFPVDSLVVKTDAFIFTDIYFHKGYFDDDYWVQPELEFTSYLTPSYFSCSLKLGSENGAPENIVTRGHLIMKELGYKWFKVSLM